MGKRIIQQRRGRGTSTYRTRKKAFIYRLNYPKSEGLGIVEKIISSPAHSAPLAKIKLGKEIFFIPTIKGMYEGQKIEIGEKAKAEKGNILPLGKIAIGKEISNIETYPYSGPKLIRAGGLTARVVKKTRSGVIVAFPSKKEKIFHKKARAMIGVIAGSGRLEKPIVKAGKMYYIKKSKGKQWPRTSAVKMNVVDHPFGGGRGKRIKSKIAKFGAPPGKKVGHLRPKRTGRKNK